VFIGKQSTRARRVHETCRAAMQRAAETIGPGVAADEVYRAWESAVQEAGFGSYTRHHCGYAVGIGFPPSWSGSGTPRGMRKGSDLKLEEGMVFHLMSWLLRTGRGDAFLSDTVLVTGEGCEFLTRVPQDVLVR
jgi:Xaa-Pro dipeptidase